MGRRVMEVTVTPPPISDLRHERRLAKQPTRAPMLPRLIARMGTNDKEAVQQRRSVAIHAYIGANGSGKTLAMVNDTIPSLDAGRPVYSTVPLYDDATGELHPGYRPFEDWRQLLEAQSADFLIDEVVAVASSRDSSSMHLEVQRRLNQLRKSDVVLRWTAPAWRRADIIIREVTIAVTQCQGMFTARAVPDPITGDIPLWSPRQLFRFRSFDMQAFDEWSSGKGDKVRADVKQWFLGPGSRAFNTYRTLDPVATIPPYDPTRCEVCDLPAARKTCRGHGN